MSDEATLPVLAVLAGGLATRLRPITETIPKSMVEVAGKPFLDHQLRLARAQGFRRVVLLIGHLGEQIRAFAGDGSRFGLRIVYSEDGPNRRGTGGALRHALPQLGEECFVLYGDSYLDISVGPAYAAFRASGAKALMTVLRNDDRWDHSNVVFDGSHVTTHDKQARGRPDLRWIDYGLSVFRTDAIRDWPEPDPFDLSALTKRLAEEGALAGYEAQNRFYEIGQPASLAETEDYLREKRMRSFEEERADARPRHGDDRPA